MSDLDILLEKLTIVVDKIEQKINNTALQCSVRQPSSITQRECLCSVAPPQIPIVVPSFFGGMSPSLIPSLVSNIVQNSASEDFPTISNLAQLLSTSNAETNEEINYRNRIAAMAGMIRATPYYKLSPKLLQIQDILYASLGTRHDLEILDKLNKSRANELKAGIKQIVEKAVNATQQLRGTKLSAVMSEIKAEAVAVEVAIAEAKKEAAKAVETILFDRLALGSTTASAVSVRLAEAMGTTVVKRTLAARALTVLGTVGRAAGLTTPAGIAVNVALIAIPSAYYYYSKK